MTSTPLPAIPAWQPVPLGEIPDYPKLIDYVRHFGRLNPAGEAAIDLDGARRSWADLAQAVEHTAARLMARGLGQGDRIAVLAPSCADAWITLLAASSLGLVWLGLNPRYTLGELDHIVSNADPRLIVVQHAIGGRDYGAEIEAFHAAGRPTVALGELVTSPEPDAAVLERLRERQEQVDPAASCLLVYTSGSTGRPKGALLGQAGLVTCSRIQAHHYGIPEGRSVNPLPINHVGWICDTNTTCLVTGSTLVFADKFDPERLLRAFGEERLSSWGGVPTMFQLMLLDPAAASADFSHVRRVLWSGSPMPLDLAVRLAGLGVPMHNFYGMTETTGSVCFTAPDSDILTAVETIGRPEASYAVRIADPETGAVCAAGETGEIQVRSPGVMLGYLGDEAATREAFTADGWLRTGDLAEARVDGNLVLRGRAREMFKSGGFNVYPREVEAALEAHPAVAAACVVAVSDPTFHEVGHAFILAEEGADAPDAAALEVHARTLLANYKVPKRFSVVTSLPMLPIGKVDRKALAAQASEIAR